MDALEMGRFRLFVREQAFCELAVNSTDRRCLFSGAMDESGVHSPRFCAREGIISARGVHTSGFCAWESVFSERGVHSPLFCAWGGCAAVLPMRSGAAGHACGRRARQAGVRASKRVRRARAASARGTQGRACGASGYGGHGDGSETKRTGAREGAYSLTRETVTGKGESCR